MQIDRSKMVHEFSEGFEQNLENPDVQLERTTKWVATGP